MKWIELQTYCTFKLCYQQSMKISSLLLIGGEISPAIRMQSYACNVVHVHCTCAVHVGLSKLASVVLIHSSFVCPSSGCTVYVEIFKG